LSEKLKDPDFRYQLAHTNAMKTETVASWAEIRRVGNFYETMGMLVKNGLADKNLVLDMYSHITAGYWEKLAPYVAIRRRATGRKAIWENFEYLTVLSQDWLAVHANGAYPAGVRQIDLQRRVARSRQAVCRLARTGVNLTQR
jgi:Domain of unknown function (DUF4760)